MRGGGDNVVEEQRDDVVGEERGDVVEEEREECDVIE